MQALSVSEQMMFSTLRLRTSTGSGTGFFFNFSTPEGVIPLIVTNKHVINGKLKETVDFEIHLDGNDFKTLEFRRVSYETNWIHHPRCDLAACFAADLINDVKTTYGRAPFHCPLSEDIVATDDKLNQLSALEEVTMVGYPQGLCDEAHGLPIFRKRYTASHPAIDFNGEPIGLMDIAGLWGSSGSPIFIYNQSGYSDRLGNTYLGTGRTIFLGIQYAIPTYTAEGKIEVKVIPTDMTPVPVVKMLQPMNPAYYIKAKEILWFKDYIKNQVLGSSSNMK